MDFNNPVLMNLSDCVLVGAGLVLLAGLIGYGIGTCLKLVFKMV